jgi:hypothetical protein
MMKEDRANETMLRTGEVVGEVMGEEEARG